VYLALRSSVLATIQRSSYGGLIFVVYLTNNPDRASTSLARKISYKNSYSYSYSYNEPPLPAFERVVRCAIERVRGVGGSVCTSALLLMLA
jgi:hypothetical protein